MLCDERQLIGRNTIAYITKWTTSCLATLMGRSEARNQLKKDFRLKIIALVRLVQQDWPNVPLNERKEIVLNGFIIIRLLTSVDTYCDMLRDQCPEFFEHFSNLVIHNTDNDNIQREAHKIIRNFYKTGFSDFPIELRHFIAKNNLAE